MEDALNTVNEVQSENVDTQTEVQDTGASTTEQVNSAPAEQKPVQTPEQNAAFASVRRDAETKARDSVIAEMYGSQGITTYSQYQKALADQKAAEEAQKIGIDPAFYQEFSGMKDELSSIKREKTLIQQERDLESDPKTGELFKQWKDEVKDFAKKANCDYDTAFTIVSRNKLPDLIAAQMQKGEQEAIKKLNANANSTPGPLSTTGEKVPELTEEMVDKMTPGELKARWKDVRKLYNMK